MDAGPSAPHQASSTDSSGAETSSTAESAFIKTGNGDLVDVLVFMVRH